jgi:hypothetical protein
MKSSGKDLYKPVSELRELLGLLDNRKFVLDCGHHVTFNQVLGNNIIILNGRSLRIICSQCGY